MEIVFGFVGLLVTCFLFFSGPIALCWLFRLRKQIDELIEQNSKLEASLRRLQHDIQSNKSNGSTQSGVITLETEESPFKIDLPAKPEPPVYRPTVPVVPFAVSSAKPSSTDSGIRKRYEDSGIQSGVRTTADWSTSATPKPAKKIDEETNVSQTLELWIGRKLFGWVAAVGFIIAAALFIQYAVKSGWVGPGLKVAAIAGFGTALLGVGFYCRRTGLRRFSTMMSSAGIILIYQAGYASFAFYKLIELSTASIVMPFIVFGGFLLAWLYRSKLLGTVAILGGLAVPLLLSSSEDHYRELFVYLMSLNIGTLILINLLRRAPIAFIAFFGTQALFWMWFAHYYNNPKLITALLFQAAFYFVYLADTAIAAWKPIGKKLIPTWDDAMRAILAPIICFGSIVIFAERDGVINFNSSLIRTNTFVLDEYLGIFAFIGAAWYVVLAWLYTRHIAKMNQTESWQAAPSAATVIAFGFIAIGIPLQFDAMWITLGWLTVFAGLWYFGHRQTNRTFVRMSYVFFTLGICRLTSEILDCMNNVRNNLELAAVFNSTALPMLACTAVLIIAAVLSSRFCRN